MEVFRLSRARYAHTLSGVGAALKGARWNSPGIEMIYTAGNRSLAMAEVLVHLSLATMSNDFKMTTIVMPEDIALQKLNNSQLPECWNTFPYSNESQVLGDQFILENRYCVLQVPSCVTKGDYNFLINPRHPDFQRVSIFEVVPFPLDNRIFQ